MPNVRKQTIGETPRPLIVIGAGRSGTTLLMRALRAHPAISFHGETAFLAPRLWQQTVVDRFWHNWERQFRLNPPSAIVPLSPLAAATRRAMEKRAGKLIAEHVKGLLGVRASAEVWGFKELWNGSPSFDVDWSIYDAIFPEATWLHVVRNPFTFARSSAQWNVRPLTLEHLQELLSIWTGIQGKSRQRSATGRYHRVRYEDLIGNPERRLKPVMRSLGIDWHAKCAAVFEERRFISRSPALVTTKTVKMKAADYAESIPDFLAQCTDAGYLKSEKVPICEDASAFEQKEIIFSGADISLG